MLLNFNLKNTYFDNGVALCESCSDACLNCVNEKDFCISCRENLLLNGSKCVKECD